MPEFDRLSPKGLEVMPHQSRFLEAVREGHRTFLLADEPGLGKTAESVLAASVADAYPLLAVVPNVVKMNWAREVERWTPQRRATVIHGDGENIDAFADVFIVNYEILDRHLSWLGSLGLKGMVVDEAHFIKNLTLAALAERAGARRAHPRAGAQPAAARPDRHARSSTTSRTSTRSGASSAGRPARSPARRSWRGSTRRA